MSMSPESKNVPDTFNFPGGIIMEWIKIFIPTTISSAALLSGIVFLLRKWIIDRLTQSIKHEYDKDLENHKEQLRKETESELIPASPGALLRCFRDVALNRSIPVDGGWPDLQDPSGTVVPETLWLSARVSTDSHGRY